MFEVKTNWSGMDGTVWDGSWNPESRMVWIYNSLLFVLCRIWVVLFLILDSKF